MTATVPDFPTLHQRKGSPRIRGNRLLFTIGQGGDAVDYWADITSCSMENTGKPLRRADGRVAVPGMGWQFRVSAIQSTVQGSLWRLLWDHGGETATVYYNPHGSVEPDSDQPIFRTTVQLPHASLLGGDASADEHHDYLLTVIMAVVGGCRPELVTSADLWGVNLAANPEFATLAVQAGTGDTPGSGGATVALDSSWSSVGSQSLKITPDGSSNEGAAYLIAYGNTATGGWQANTYTIGLDYHLDAAQTGSLRASARTVQVGYTDSGGTDHWTLASSDAAPNEAGTTRLVTSFTVPDDATCVFVWVNNGSPDTTAPCWVDAVTIEQGVTDGAWFDNPYTT